MTRGIDIKQKALEMRRSGSAYNEIARELVVAKSTLAAWFSKTIEDFDEVKKQNIEKNRVESSVRFFEFTKERKRLLFIKYDQAIVDAHTEFELFKNDPLFIAGLMLYAGEGDKASRANIRISNTDWQIHEIFIQFLEKYLLFPRKKVSIALLAYPDNDIQILIDYWANKLSINKDKFHKTQILPGKSRKRLQFGIGMTIITNTRAKYKLLEWIKLSLNLLSK
jgi:hypothetical protein